MKNQTIARIAVATVAVLVVGCGQTSNEGVETALGAAPDPATTPESASGVTPTVGEIAPGPEVDHGMQATSFETFAQVSERFPIVVIARATDITWKERPPNSSAAANDEYEDRLPRDGSTADDFYYLWREFEVLEVLHGGYEGPTLYRGGFVDQTETGKIYVLFGGDIGTPDGGIWRSKEYVGDGIPPYELTTEELMVATEPTLQPGLPANIVLAEFRELIGDASDG